MDQEIFLVEEKRGDKKKCQIFKVSIFEFFHIFYRTLSRQKFSSLSNWKKKVYVWIAGLQETRIRQILLCHGRETRVSEMRRCRWRGRGRGGGIKNLPNRRSPVWFPIRLFMIFFSLIFRHRPFRANHYSSSFLRRRKTCFLPSGIYRTEAKLKQKPLNWKTGPECPWGSGHAEPRRWSPWKFVR